MDITFPTRSKFLEACEGAIRSGRTVLEAGRAISISFDEKGGYTGSVRVTIQSNDGNVFDTNWTGDDASRFPARIKAAALALLNCGCKGMFEVSHEDGALSIRMA